MKNRNCPDKDTCWGYKESSCEGCAIGEKIARLVRQNKKLKVENVNLRHRAEAAERALENKCKNVCSACEVHNAAVREQAIREFAMKLKKKADPYNYEENYIDRSVMYTDIDDIVTEVCGK